MRILITEPEGFSPPAAAALAGMAEVWQREVATEAELLQAVRTADILWIRLRHYISARVLDAAPHLKVIATPTTGLTHIDLEAAQARGIQVISLRGETDFLKEIRATAELTLALTLALLRRLPQAHFHVIEGGWDRDLFRGRELHGKTAGIVGYGRLGRIVASYFHAFGCQVLAHDRPDWAGSPDPFVSLVPLEELLTHSDIVSLHANFQSGMRGFFSRRCFEQMKPGSWFVNTARGELVDEAALVDALESGRLGGAALDVLADEHLRAGKAHPLVAFAATHDNLVLTPHIGGCTRESMEKTEEFLAGKVAAYLAAEAAPAAAR